MRSRKVIFAGIFEKSSNEYNKNHRAEKFDKNLFSPTQIGWSMDDRDFGNS
jgi:hypothetical protein